MRRGMQASASCMHQCGHERQTIVPNTANERYRHKDRRIELLIYDQERD